MHRLGKKKADKVRNVVIKLKDKEMRDNIYNQRKKLIKPGNLSCSVYFNDSLTLHRQQLSFAARKLVKARKIYAAWSQQGNGLVNKTEKCQNLHLMPLFSNTKSYSYSQTYKIASQNTI